MQTPLSWAPVGGSISKLVEVQVALSYAPIGSGEFRLDGGRSFCATQEHVTFSPIMSEATMPTLSGR